MVEVPTRVGEGSSTSAIVVVGPLSTELVGHSGRSTCGQSPADGGDASTAGRNAGEDAIAEVGEDASGFVVTESRFPDGLDDDIGSGVVLIVAQHVIETAAGAECTDQEVVVDVRQDYG